MLSAVYLKKGAFGTPFDDKTKLIARLVLRQKGKIYWPIFQLAELVFFTVIVRKQVYPLNSVPTARKVTAHAKL